MFNRKRICISLGIFILILSISSLGLAGTVGNSATTSDPKGSGIFSMRQNKNFSVKSGVDFEILFDKDIKASDGSNTELTSGEWYMAKVSCLMFNRVEPYIKLGMAHMKARWTEAGTTVKLESDTNFAWALGSKFLIWDFKQPNLKIIGDGFYRMADLEGEEGYYGSTKIDMDANKSRFLIREWQIALLAATEIDVASPGNEGFLGVSTIIPYAGVKYSDMNGRLRLSWTSGNYNNPGKFDAADNFGIFAGCDFVGPDSVSLNLEGRFLDETAITTGLSVLF